MAVTRDSSVSGAHDEEEEGINKNKRVLGKLRIRREGAPLQNKSRCSSRRLT
jgi:hypothetical protein